MYKIKSDILGFESYKSIQIKPFDKFFSQLSFDEENYINMTIMNSCYLKNIPLNLDENMMEIMEVKDSSQYDIYFIMVIQDPIENSILNLAAPIIINHDKQLIGQFMTKEGTFYNTATIKTLSI